MAITDRNFDELADHRERFRERMAQQKLSVMELRRAARERHSALLTADNIDRQQYISEIEVLDQMATDAMPPPPSPQQLADQLQETNPDLAATLQHTLRRHQLQQDADSAREALARNPDAKTAQDAAQDALEALSKHDKTPPAPIAKQTRIAELRQQIDNLPGQQQEALVSGDIDRSTELAQSLLDATAELNQINGTGTPTPPAGSTDDTLTAEQIALQRAEQRVADSMAREAADKAAADLIR